MYILDESEDVVNQEIDEGIFSTPSFIYTKINNNNDNKDLENNSRIIMYYPTPQNNDSPYSSTCDEQEENDILLLDQQHLIINNEIENSILPITSTSAILFHRERIRKVHNSIYLVMIASFVLYITFCFVTSLSRPYDERMELKSIPLSQRSIDWNINMYIPSFLQYDESSVIRSMKDNDKNYYNYYNDNDNDNNNDKENADDPYGYNVDNGDYYNKAAYYTKKPTKSPTKTPTKAPEVKVDDFFRFIDDDTLGRKVFPLQFSDYTGFLCITFSLILAVGGGIGPGAILITVYIIVLHFPPKVAIPLNGITCMGASLVSTIFNSMKRHPLTDRPIIDWDLILILEPITLFGAVTGTYVNKVLPEKMIATMLVLLLSLIAHHTLGKARKMHLAEELYIKKMNWARAKKKLAMEQNANNSKSTSFDNRLAEADPPFIPRVHEKPSASPSSDPLNASVHSFFVFQRNDQDSIKSSLIEEEADQLPQHKITYIVAMLIFVIGMNVFKGGGAFESPVGIRCGSYAFWFLEFLTGVWLIGCTYLAGRYLLRRNAIKEAVGFDYVRGDIRWDIRTILIYPAVCLFAGLVSGMFGIGCAVIIAPLLVGVGVTPSVAAATCACMNLFTSTAATSSYVVLGSVIPDSQYAFAALVLGILATYFGGFIMTRALSATKMEKNQRIERHSYIAYCMGVVVLVSALSMTIEALVSVIYHSYDEEESDGICEIERYS